MPTPNGEFSVKVKIESEINSASNDFKKLSGDAVKTGKNITASWDKIADNVNKASADMAKKNKNATDSMKKGYAGVGKIADKIFGPLGITLGVGALISQGHSMNQMVVGWHNSFRLLSNSTGDTTKAVNTMTSAFGKTNGSLDDVRGSMGALNSKGLAVGNKQFEEMTVWVSNLSNATGISADTFADFTVGLTQMYKVTLKTTAKMTSSLMALGDGFGFTNIQIEEVMKATQSALTNIAFLFDNVDKSMLAMTKSIGAGSAVMKNFGISVQDSGSFFSDMLDPHKINEHMILFNRLGISYGETMDMMTSENGQETFVDKLMTNMPALSRQILSLKNPLARLDFAESLGMPLVLAQKMAKATAGEVQGIMEKYKEMAKDQDANSKKQAKDKVDAKRFDDTLMFFKMKALMPMMNFVQNNYKDFMDVVSALSNAGSKILGVVAWGFQAITDIIVPPLTALLNGDILKAIGSLASGIGNKIAYAFEKNPWVAALTGSVIAFIGWTKYSAIKTAFYESAGLAFFKAAAYSPIKVRDVAAGGTGGTTSPGGTSTRPSATRSIASKATTMAMAVGGGYLGGKAVEYMGGGEGAQALGQMAGMGIATKATPWLLGMMKTAGTSIGAAVSAPIVIAGIAAAAAGAVAYRKYKDSGKTQNVLDKESDLRGMAAGSHEKNSIANYGGTITGELWKANEMAAGALTRGFNYITGSDTVTGKGFFDGKDTAELKGNQKVQELVKAGTMKMNKWEIAALDAKVAYQKSKQKMFFSIDELNRKYEIRNKKKHLENLLKEQTGADAKATQAKLDALDLEGNLLLEKQRENLLDENDALATMFARIGKAIGFSDGDLMEITARIRNDWTDIGASLTESMDDAKEALKNYGAESMEIDEMKKDSTEFKEITRAGKATIIDPSSLKNLKAWQSRIAASAGKDPEAIARAKMIVDNYTTNMNIMNKRFANAFEAREVERKRIIAENAEKIALAKAGVKAQGYGNSYLSKIKDNTKPETKTGTSQDYINFYLKNQGFMSTVWQA